ncbi:alpha/beta hydrolase [Nocardioides sp.]|uniref:alpha/beta fold hydrolase n=1 Tax=Nocardioides sp. TaxID=35761 RepID=UPI002C518D69|nr:alpha/beta hydrolase [Nocardioides sp.]HXH79937.1 alpha/beta hydrolase [Nocardioides sp.]
MTAGPRLVCVPGLGLRDDAWAPTIAALGLHEAVVQHLPGFGVRATPDDDLTPAALGARLAAGLAEESRPTVLMGHSASSQIVVHAAALIPHLISAVVLVGPTTDPRAASWPRLVARWFRNVVWEPPWQVPILARCYRRTGLGWMLRAMGAARRDDIRVALSSVRCPVLVVRGPHDHISPAYWARDLASTAPPGSAAVTLAKGAHMVPLTHGDLLAAAVAEFLDAR